MTGAIEAMELAPGAAPGPPVQLPRHGIGVEDDGIGLEGGIGADLPSLDLPRDRPEPDHGPEPGVLKLPDFGLQLDPPADFPLFDDPVQLDPPLFGDDPPFGQDIEGGKPGPAWPVPPTVPEPDAGIRWGPWGPALAPRNRP